MWRSSSKAAKAETKAPWAPKAGARDVPAEEPRSSSPAGWGPPSASQGGDGWVKAQAGAPKAQLMAADPPTPKPPPPPPAAEQPATAEPPTDEQPAQAGADSTASEPAAASVAAQPDRSSGAFAVAPEEEEALSASSAFMPAPDGSSLGASGQPISMDFAPAELIQPLQEASAGGGGDDLGSLAAELLGQGPEAAEGQHPPLEAALPQAEALPEALPELAVIELEEQPAAPIEPAVQPAAAVEPELQPQPEQAPEAAAQPDDASAELEATLQTLLSGPEGASLMAVPDHLSAPEEAADMLRALSPLPGAAAAALVGAERLSGGRSSAGEGAAAAEAASLQRVGSVKVPAAGVASVPAAPAARRRSSLAGTGPRQLRRRSKATEQHKQGTSTAGPAPAARASGTSGSAGGASAAGGDSAGGSAEVEAVAEVVGEGEGRQEDILAELEAQRARHAEQLRLEGKVRAELEGMITRIERHFKKEQLARKKAEEQLAAAAAERDALHAQLEAERAQQAVLLQQAVQERAAAEEQYQAQLAALGAELEQSRQELAARTQALAAEVAAWRGSADAAARELQERAQEFASAGHRVQQLAELLAAGGPAAATTASPTGSAGASVGSTGSGPGFLGTAGREESPTRRQQPQSALHFHRSPAASAAAVRAGPGASARAGPGAGAGASHQTLPHLEKTQAVPGAQLRHPGEAGGHAGGGLPALGGTGSGGPHGGVRRERSGLSGGPSASASSSSPTAGGWKASGDRFKESQRDAGRMAYMSRWGSPTLSACPPPPFLYPFLSSPPGPVLFFSTLRLVALASVPLAGYRQAGQGR